MSTSRLAPPERYELDDIANREERVELRHRNGAVFGIVDRVTYDPGRKRDFLHVHLKIALPKAERSER